MNDKEKARVFRDLRAEQAKRRILLITDTRSEILHLLKLAEERLRLHLAMQPGEATRWVLSDLQAEVQQMMREFGDQAAARLSSAASASWEAGQALVDLPLEPLGFRLAGVAPMLDASQLMAMRTFMTDRIRNVGIEVANKLNTELALTVMGAQPPAATVSRVADILGETSRSRAITIVRTELSRVYGTATQERLVQAGGGETPIVPGLKKQWRRSGKVYSRINHDLADGQVRDVDKPFQVGAVKMMFPHDPKAPASETINCGCTMLPWRAEWDVVTPGRKRYSALEMQANPIKRDIQDALDSGQSLKDLLSGGKAA
jgi:hypothetical protein